MKFGPMEKLEFKYTYTKITFLLLCFKSVTWGLVCDFSTDFIIFLNGITLGSNLHQQLGALENPFYFISYCSFYNCYLMRFMASSRTPTIEKRFSSC